MFFSILIANCLAIAANAHVILTHPTPFGLSTLQNGPLQPDGSDFPCKLRDGVYDLEGASNVYAQGSTQYLAFRGSAVHGGGSCQISVTTDLHPDKNSRWKVIKSIEGGCPAQDQVGNLPGDYSVIDPYTYNYTIPAELPAGSYTLAWTWFNKIGNREMYMNCAPLNVTGYGGSADFLNSLPDMFEANISGDEGCSTKANTDLEFPNPGKDVVRLNGATDAFLAPLCPSKTSSGGYRSTPAPIPNPVPSYAPPVVVTPAPAPTNIPSIVSSTRPIGQPATSRPVKSAPATLAVPAPVSTPAPLPISEPGSGSPGAVPNSDGVFPAGTTCEMEGQWNCVNGHSFQRCGSGVWSTVLPLATGVQCTPGQATELRLISRRSKNALRHVLRHKLLSK